MGSEAVLKEGVKMRTERLWEELTIALKERTPWMGLTGSGEDFKLKRRKRRRLTVSLG